MPKTIRDEIIWVIGWSYSLLTQFEKRQFGGSGPGKGRRLAVIAAISAKLAQRIDHSMMIISAEQPATAGDVAKVIEKSLAAVTPEDAYRTLERSAEQPEKARLELSEKLADDLLLAFDIIWRPFTGLDAIVSMKNGPSAPKPGTGPG